MNYTKGEWKVTKHKPLDNYVIAVLGEKQYLDDTICQLGYSPNMLANAHLIAAAPDMYEALQELTEITHDLGLGDGSPDPQVEASNRKARQALAKAEGKEEK